MRFFADENLERPIIEGLRQQGHDIATVPTEEKGSPDPTVLALSNSEDRVLPCRISPPSGSPGSTVHREAVAALVLFQEAIREEQITAAFVRELAAYLDAARTDPTLRFRQSPG